MAIFKRGGVYWYKFMWNGKVIACSTKQGNDRRAREIEAAHRARLASERDEHEQAKQRLKCSEVLLCDECDKWFNAEYAQRQKDRMFCSSKCLTDWTKKNTRIPTLVQFLECDFKPYVKAHYNAKPKTATYYDYGVTLLLEAEIGDLLLNEISSQHAAGYKAKQAKRSLSTVNCGLRTLRRALNLAVEWGKIDRTPKIVLDVKGERQRDRVVTLADFLPYNELCRQPWRDVATVIYGSGIRPGEAYKLRWEHVLMNGTGGLIQIAEGKSKAARRYLPMVPEVYATLKARHAAQGWPATGWVFPSESASGHLEQSSAKNCHDKAVKKLTSASAAYRAWVKQGSEGEWTAAVESATKLSREYLQRHGSAIRSGWKGFEPYCLRHSALTMLAESGCDAFTLARIAGHSSITITQRYIHPQADAIERAFRKLSGDHEISGLGPEGGYKIGYSPELAEKSESGQMAASDCNIEDLNGAPGVIRTPDLLIRSSNHTKNQ